MYILITILVILGILLIFIYNTMLSKRNKLLKSYSSLDVMLKRRYDLIPNIVETVKGYVKYEQELFSKITEIRGRKNNNLDDMIKNDLEYNDAIEQINILVEKYPNLKASDNFIHLQKVLNETEEQISAARRTYNAHVESYNSYISFIPFNIIAKLFGFKKYDFFKIESIERENPKIKREDLDNHGREI